MIASCIAIVRAKKYKKICPEPCGNPQNFCNSSALLPLYSISESPLLLVIPAIYYQLYNVKIYCLLRISYLLPSNWTNTLTKIKDFEGSFMTSLWVNFGKNFY
jgi:hypothetical protein